MERSDRYPGFFITLEGGEGAGKSTNLRWIQAWLLERGIDCLCTREPGGTALSEKIRSLILTDSGEPLDSTAELLLIFAARAQHLSEVIKPALNEGKVVLCDRFTDSTFAYQGWGQQRDLSAIGELEHLVQDGLQPDLTLLFDLPTTEGMHRVRSRNRALDRMEKQKMDFFQRVREGYLQRAAQDPARFVVVDAMQSLPLVQTQLNTALCERLKHV